MQTFEPQVGQPINLGVVDNCLILGLPDINRSVFTSDIRGNISSLLDATLKLKFNKLIVDLRKVHYFYDDFRDLVEDVFPEDTIFAVSSSEQQDDLDIERFREVVIAPRLYTKKITIPSEFYEIVRDSVIFNAVGEFDLCPMHPSLKKATISKEIDDIISRSHRRLPGASSNFSLDQELEILEDATQEAVKSIMGLYFNRITCESPLTQLSIIPINGKLKCSVYHTGAVYNTREGKEIFIARPTIITSRTNLVLKREITEFENLINDESAREDEFQDFFERHPNLLLGSEYEALYPQVRLQKEDGDVLIPDFFLQPAVSYPWSDILELKLPTIKIVNEQKNRSGLSASVKRAMDQLREYSAYFEDPRHRDKIYSTTKIRCYCPKMILVIGRYTSGLNEMNVRRELSTYSNISVKTYDELLEHARRRLLL